MEIIDKEFIPKDFQEKESDLIYKVRIRDREVIFYFMIEMQSSVDFTIPFRMLIYITELYKRLFLDTLENERERKGFRLPAIIPCVLYNGGSEWTAVRSFKEYLDGYVLFEKNVIDFEYILISINKYTDDELMKIGNLISSIFILDNKQNATDVLGGLLKSVTIYNKLEMSEQIQFVDWLKDVLMKKVRIKKEKELVYHMLEQLEKGEVIQMTHTIERIWDEIEEKGRKKGCEEGREKGHEEGMRLAKKIFVLSNQGKSVEQISEELNLDIEIVMKALN